MGAPRDVTATGGQGRLPPPGLLTPWTGQGAWDGRVDLAVRMAGGLRDYLRGLQLMHRLLLWCLFAVAAIFLLPHSALAHTVTNCQGNAGLPRCDQGVAYAAINTIVKDHCTALQPGATVARLTIDHSVAAKRYNAGFGCKSAAGANIAFDQQHYTTYNTECSGRPEYNGAFPGGQYKPKNGSLSCDLGCEVMWTHNADGTVNGNLSLNRVCTADDMDSDDDCKAKLGSTAYFNRQVGVCELKDGECKNGAKPNSLGQCAPEPCPEGMAQQPDGTCKKKDNECPAGQVRSPDGKCLPGDGQCAKGEVRGPDGTCKKDADEDGNPDPVNEDSFSGGDDCTAPPSCSGSPIMCGQARIQWRIDCNTRRNRNVAGGACNTMPVCTGEKCDAMEYAGLLMQWRSTCALEKMAHGNGNGGGDNADIKAIRDALTGTGGTVTLPPDRPASDAWAPGGGTATTPDTSGYGWGGTCPQPPSIEVFGNAIQINTAPLCNWLFLGGYFVMGLAALASLRIVASKDA